MRKKLARWLLILGGMLLGAVLAWFCWGPWWAPAGSALVGTWITPPQPDGFATVLRLDADRRCRVRWLDRTGQDDPARPPRPGYWWVEGKTLFVDTSLEAQPMWFEFNRRQKRAALAWTFAIRGEGLVLGPQTATPVLLRRLAASAP